MPKVSIVINCSAGAENPKRTIQSVVDQTYSDFEVLLVGDLPHDSAAQLSHRSGRKTRTIRASHTSVAEAQNLGIRESEAEYVAFVSSDCVFQRNFLEQTVRILESDPVIAFVGCSTPWGDPDIVDSAGNPSAFPRILVDDQVSFATVWRKARVIECGGLDPNMPVSGHESWDLAITMVGRGYRGAAIPQPLALRGRLAQSGSTQHIHFYRLTLDYLTVKHSRHYQSHLGGVLETIERCTVELAETVQSTSKRSPADVQRIALLEHSLRSTLESRNWRLTNPLRQMFISWKTLRRRNHNQGKSAPRLSIILTCQDQGRDLPRILETLKSQIGSDDELIIVDAHSTDSVTRQILDWHQEAGFRVIRTNVGRAAARFVGLKHAAGNILFAMGLEHAPTPNFIAQAVQTIERDRETAFVTCGIRDQASGFSWTPESDGLTDWLACPRVSFPVLRREAFEQAGGYDGNLSHPDLADWDLMVRMTAKGAKGLVLDGHAVTRDAQLTSLPLTEVLTKNRPLFDAHWSGVILSYDARRRHLEAHVDQPNWNSPDDAEESREWAHLQPVELMAPVARRRPGFRNGESKWKLRREEQISVENSTISVVIPTKNAGDDFRALLSMLQNQQGFQKIEIVVVDSGSSDQTLAVARDFSAKVIEISPEVFSHSYARNLGAAECAGDYIVFMVQDAMPPSLTWLHELHRPIRLHGAVASSCAEFPKEDADLLYRTLSRNHYKFIDIHGKDRILQQPKQTDHISLRKSASLSDIACMIDREVFLQHKFKGEYAEDLDLGLRLIDSGHKLALVGSTRVVHSHNRSAYYYLKRGYVDTLFLAKHFRDYPVKGIETETLVKDIAFAYEVVSRLTTGIVRRLPPSCSMETFASYVKNELSHVLTRPRVTRFSIRREAGVDDAFQSFVADICRRSQKKNPEGARADGLLVEAFRTRISTVIQYMDEVYDVLDTTLINEFRDCAFKALALDVGIQLASNIVATPAARRGHLESICLNLEHAV